MNIQLLGRKAKAIAQKIELSVNQRFQRQYIAREADAFNIETSGICNLKCRFCAYPKKTIPKEIMSQALFEKSVMEAIMLGYTDFELTPCTGEVFMDRNLFEKLAFLDHHPGVKQYSFFTNLTVPDEYKILQLKKLKKLKSMTISVYGHDEESFIKITQRTSAVYQQLISNLNVILKHHHEFKFSLGIGFRSEYKALNKKTSSELKSLMEALKKVGIGVTPSHGIYNNWGGYVTQDDVIGLDLVILNNDFVPKRGACSKLFDSIQITASGVVNACSCRDVDSRLKIGDIKDTPLSEILKPSNPQYRELIEEQESNFFRPVCKNCDYYRSIYHQPKSYRKNNIRTLSINAFFLKPFPKNRK